MVGSSGGEPTILILEDEPLILMDLELSACESHCIPLTACCVREALSLIHGHSPPDVAIIDVTLQDGETSLPVAHELGRLGIPFIVHSGDFERYEDELHAEITMLVPKPTSARRVVAVALECLAIANSKRPRATNS